MVFRFPRAPRDQFYVESSEVFGFQERFEIDSTRSLAWFFGFQKRFEINSTRSLAWFSASKNVSTSILLGVWHSFRFTRAFRDRFYAESSVVFCFQERFEIDSTRSLAWFSVHKNVLRSILRGV